MAGRYNFGTAVEGYGYNDTALARGAKKRLSRVDL